MPSSRDAELEVRDPLAHWTRHAHRRSRALSLPPGFIEAGRDIVVGAFGNQWLEERFQGAEQGIGLALREHPLIEDFVVAGDNQIVEVLELAVYLKRLVRVQGLEEVVPMMKQSEQFSTGLLQLGYAYRLQRLGGVVGLEPVLPDGRKSDIEVRFNERLFLAECYVPHFGKKGLMLDVLQYTVPKLLKVAKYFSIKMRLRLEFQRELTQGERSQLELSSREVIIESSEGGKAIRSLDFVTIESTDITHLQEDLDWPDPTVDEPRSVPGEADLVCSEFSIQKHDVEAVRDGRPVPKDRGSRILIRWPELTMPSTESRLAELEARFEEKLLQTRGYGAGRILIAQVGEGMEPATGTHGELAQSLLQRLSSRHERLSAVILTSRVWTTRSRYRFQGLVLYGPEDAGLREILTKGLNEIDHEIDLLQDCGCGA